MRIFLLCVVAVFALGACQPQAETYTQIPIPDPTPVAVTAQIDAPAVVTNAQTDPEIGDTLPVATPNTGQSLAQAALEEKRRRDALAARGVSEIGWEDLMPEGEEERLAELFQAQMQMIYSQNIGEGSSGDQMTQIGTFNTVKTLNETKIRMAGYTVPFIFGKDELVEEFLLVPYFGACLHAPPPPPNQTVFVQLTTPVKRGDLAQAVWVEGTMQTEIASTDLADAAYTLIADEVVKFEY